MMDLDKLKDAAANAADSVKKASSGAADRAAGAGEDAGDRFAAVKDVLRDEQKTDAGLDKAADAANRATGGKFREQVNTARDFADKRLGDEYK